EGALRAAVGPGLDVAEVADVAGRVARRAVRIAQRGEVVAGGPAGRAVLARLAGAVLVDVEAVAAGRQTAEGVGDLDAALGGRERDLAGDAGAGQRLDAGGGLGLGGLGRGRILGGRVSGRDV